MFYTYSAEGYLIDQRETNIVIAATVARNFISASIVKSSEVNGAVNNYTFTIIPSSPLKAGDLIYLKAPDTVSAPLNPICNGITSLSSSLTCFTLNKITQITIATNLTQINELSEVKFTVQGYGNPTSF